MRHQLFTYILLIFLLIPTASLAENIPVNQQTNLLNINLPKVDANYILSALNKINLTKIFEVANGYFKNNNNNKIEITNNLSEAEINESFLSFKKLFFNILSIFWEITLKIFNVIVEVLSSKIK